jgi:hypothetical protein
MTFRPARGAVMHAAYNGPVRTVTQYASPQTPTATPGIEIARSRSVAAPLRTLVHSFLGFGMSSVMPRESREDGES